MTTQMPTLPGFNIPIVDTTQPKPRRTPAEGRQRRTIQDAFADLRRIHDELNQALQYSKRMELPEIHSPADAAQWLMPFMIPLQQEELWVICLNTRNRVIQFVKIYQGSLNSSQVRICELFREAIATNSAAIIVAHNHPSGDPTPSPDDVALTRAMVQAGKLLDIDVLDHLVIGADRFVSLKERGLGFA